MAPTSLSRAEERVAKRGDIMSGGRSMMAAVLLLLTAGCVNKEGQAGVSPPATDRSAQQAKQPAPSPTPSGVRPPPFTKTDWDNAERAIARLLPREFPNLPTEIVQELERRNCTIPQSDFAREPHNAIKGRFTRARQMDWAVLCSNDGSSSIFVFRSGSTRNLAVLAPADDRGFLQHTGGSSIGYSRMIGVADASFIRAMNDAYGHIKLPRLDHHGINDAYVEKGSTVLYWNGTKWLELAGAD